MQDKMRAEIISLCQKLNQKNMLAAGDGNISVKMDDGSILITERGKNKAYLSEDDFAVVSPDGEVVSGKPSTEIAMHQSVYQTCKKARAVVHAHPPYVIGYSIAHPFDKEMKTGALPEVILGIGSLPIAQYGRPGTKDLSRSVEDVLRRGCRAIILARHGGLAWGESLLEAYNGIERMEHAAMVLAAAEKFGGPVEMAKPEIDTLKKMFKERGENSL